MYWISKSVKWYVFKFLVLVQRLAHIYLLGICYCCYVIASCFRFLLFIHSGFHLIFIYLYVFSVWKCVHNKCYLFSLIRCRCHCHTLFISFILSRSLNIVCAHQAQYIQVARQTASTSLNSHKFFLSIVFPFGSVYIILFYFFLYFDALLSLRSRSFRLNEAFLWYFKSHTQKVKTVGARVWIECER